MTTTHVVIVLWIAMVIGMGQGCPELCSCTDKYGRHFAECSYKHLTEIPDGLPTNVSILSLSANRITMLTLGCFENVTQVTSLWMANNAIVSIEEGSLTPLVNLRNFDISYNQIVDFPWEDLQNLTSLQLLKMNHNEMVSLPKDAFSSLKDLRSLRLNNNRFVTIAQGTFDGLISLSHLQLYDNPFTCICSMDWLRDWILKTTISVPEQNFITCATPPRLKGAIIVKLPESKCMSPNVTIISEPNISNTTLHEDAVLILTCEFKGNPKPAVIWTIHSQSQKRDIALLSEGDDSAESAEALLDNDPFQVFSNGTLVILHLSEKDSGNYSCSATNEFGKAEETVSLKVLPQPTIVKTVTEVPIFTKFLPSLQPVAKTSIYQTFHIPNLERKDIDNGVPPFPPVLPSVKQPVAKTSIFHTFHLPNLESKENNIDPSFPPIVDTEYYKQAPTLPPYTSKCGLTPNTRYISNHAFNGSLSDVKQYTFDFGVIALDVSETEARVRINPLLIPKVKASSLHATLDGLQTNDPETPEPPEGSQKHDASLYLCITADRKHSAVQWSRIEDGLNTYLFQGLRPGTNYSLCLTYGSHDCEVRVLFATRRRVPNLLIIISVSICLLTVSTVPLLGATCFHLVYKYRSKTYKLIMKAKDQYHVDRKLTTRFHTPCTESQRNINGSELGEAESESRDGEKDGDTEGSVVTESFTLSQCRGNIDDCEEGSEYSDRLPLGAEAVNITSNYKYPNH